MKKAPNLLSIPTVVEISQTANAEVAPGKYVPARPAGFYSLASRIKLAWGVFTGKYDALKWDGQ